jgi:hypothetical protein
MNPLESAYGNRIGVDELPVQILGGWVEIIDVEREGDDGRPIDEVLRRRCGGELIGDDGEIS